MIILATDVEVVALHQAQCRLCAGWKGEARITKAAAEGDKRDHLDWHRDHDAAQIHVAKYLGEHGLQVLDTNWKHQGHQLAMVCWAPAAGPGRSPQMVLIDLRVNKRHHGAPLEKISNARRQVIRALGSAWLREHGSRADTMRIDVVGMLRDGTHGFTIEHVRDV